MTLVHEQIWHRYRTYLLGPWDRLSRLRHVFEENGVLMKVLQGHLGADLLCFPFSTDLC